VKEADFRRQQLRDDQIPAFPALLGSDASDLIRVGFCGDETPESVRLTQVTWRPGRSLTTMYEVAISGQAAREHVVLFAGKQLPEGGVTFGRGDDRIVGWRIEDDPLLPGLAAVMTQAPAADLLASIGAGKGSFRIRPRAYRTGRRAVVEFTGDGFKAFAKVVPPSKVEALQARHRLLAAALPVPRSHGWSPEFGIVLLQSLEGVTLREALAFPETALPGPESLLGILEAIPAPGDDRRAVSPVEAAQDHARLLRRLMPELSDAIDGVVRAVSRPLPAEPLVPVHGDYYEAQVLTTEGQLSGLLDVDTVGLGHRADDYATFLGHLAVWERSAPYPGRVRDYARQVLALADRLTDPAALRLRIAAVILGLSTGPFRAQDRDWPERTRAWLQLAERWAASADRIQGQHKKGLMVVSATP